MLEPLIVSFLLVLLSEIVDKTQLVILGLAIKYSSPMNVFAGALLAHALMDSFAILIGTFAGFVIPSYVKIIVGIAFIFVGLWGLREKEEKKKKIKAGTAFYASFAAVFMSEFGDKTQIASGLLAARYLLPIHVFIGIFAALAIAIGVNVFFGRKIAKKLPKEYIEKVSALLFIIFGFATLFL